MVKEIKEVNWEAEEYIVRSHSASWFVGFALVCAGLIALSIWQQWWTFLVLVALCAIAILINIFRPPRKIKYSINKDGITEGGVLHSFADFRAFGIMKEGNNYSAILIPKKRFGMQFKVYFPEVNGEAIVDMLGKRLLMEEVKYDFLDKIVNFLRI